MVLALNSMLIWQRWSSKNRFAGQNIDNALKQYQHQPRQQELLFAFNKRTLVHFCVDQDEVFMTANWMGIALTGF